MWAQNNAIKLTSRTCCQGRQADKDFKADEADRLIRLTRQTRQTADKADRLKRQTG